MLSKVRVWPKTSDISSNATRAAQTYGHDGCCGVPLAGLHTGASGWAAVTTKPPFSGVTSTRSVPRIVGADAAPIAAGLPVSGSRRHTTPYEATAIASSQIATMSTEATQVIVEKVGPGRAPCCFDPTKQANLPRERADGGQRCEDGAEPGAKPRAFLVCRHRRRWSARRCRAASRPRARPGLSVPRQASARRRSGPCRRDRPVWPLWPFPSPTRASRASSRSAGQALAHTASRSGWLPPR